MSISLIIEKFIFFKNAKLNYKDFFIHLFILTTFYSFIFSHALYETLTQIFYITLCYLIITRRIHIKDIIDTFSILIFCFFLIATISNIYNNKPLQIVYRILTWLFPYLLAKLIIRYRKITPEKFMYILCMAVFLFASAGVVGDIFSVNTLFGKEIFCSNRFDFTLKNANNAGFYLSGSLLSLLAIYINDKKNNLVKQVFVYYIPMITILYSLILTAEKKSIYLLPFFLVSFILISKKFKIFAYLLTVIILVLSITNIPDRLDLSNISLQSSTVSSRIKAWEISYNLIKQKPIIGHGYTSFTDISKQYFNENKETFTFEKYKPLYGAHNIILNTLTETGIFGLSCILLIFMTILFRIFQKLNTNNLVFYIGLILIFIFLKTLAGIFIRSFPATNYTFLLIGICSGFLSILPNNHAIHE